MRALLLCRTGADAGLAHRIVGERAVIGRAQDCDVSIVDDRLSRHHAQITSRDGSAWVEDLGSHDGTKVNRDRVPLGEEVPLVHFDVIELGGVELVWLELARVPGTEVVAASLVGPGGERVPLRVGENDLGSSDECDLIVPDDSVQPRHARLTLSARGLEMELLDPQARFKVNGVVLARADLADGDVVELSPTAEFRIELFSGSASIEAPGEKALGSTVPPTGPNRIDSEARPAPAEEPELPAEAPAEAEGAGAAPEPESVSAATTEEVPVALPKPPVETPAAPEPAPPAAAEPAEAGPAGIPVERLVEDVQELPRSASIAPAVTEPWTVQETRTRVDDGDTAGIPIAELEAFRRQARERHAALLAEASMEDTGKGRVTEIQEATLDLAASMRRPMPARHAAAPMDFKAVRREAAVCIHVQAPGLETRTTLLREGRHVLGRSDSCRVVVAHPSVSREHAEIHVGPQGVRVRDLGSANGTRRGNQRVTDMAVPPGDRLAFGEVIAWFEAL